MKNARELIAALFDTTTAKKAEIFGSLLSGWGKVAGEDIAAHSKVIDYRHGAVVVEVDHPGWIQMIRLRERRILHSLQRGYPDLDIKVIKVYAASDPAHIVQTDGVVPVAPAAAEEVVRLRGVESEEHRAFRELLDRMKRLGR